MQIIHHDAVGQGAEVETTRLLQDLNGRRVPHGLVRHFRDLFGVSDATFDYSFWDETYVRLLREYVDLWLETGYRKGVNTPAARHPTAEIGQIVEDVVATNRVLPAARKDGYAMAIVASPAPLRGRSKALRDEALARAAAQTVFVAMLMSDARLKIAKCVREGCGLYFRLGKWNHLYGQGTRCLACRAGEERGAKQGRVEANRAQAKRALYAYAAQRFARRIVPGRRWYRNPALKAEIAAALNQHFQQDPLFQTLYPRALTGKWVEAGRSGSKNWLLIERAKTAGRSDRR